MSDTVPAGASLLPGPGGFKRRSVAVSATSLVETRPLFPEGALPLLIEPRELGVDLCAWAAGQRAFLDEKLRHYGGLLFRGFGLKSAAGLQQFIHAVSGEALEYRERSSPRSAVEGRIYTSTDYPPKYPIFLHNENSYQSIWPLKIFFACHTAAEEGGETPIADCRRVLAGIDPEVRARFAAKGWMYVRNFGDGFGLEWQTVFQTTDKAEVEAHCAKSGIAVEWKDGNRLRTRAIRPALTRHPGTGEELWFNHATFFHVSTLAPEIRGELLALFDEEDLPANTYYGDGSPIEPDTLDHLRSLYYQETLQFPWQEGDVLMLDNMMVAHGRSPFRGERKILVGMSEPVLREQPTS
jgi:alpha-ketoglutarate-dependent taurine dioxygenase